MTPGGIVTTPAPMSDRPKPPTLWGLSSSCGWTMLEAKSENPTANEVRSVTTHPASTISAAADVRKVAGEVQPHVAP
ncbi:hypothetical protein CTU88_41675 [Streptomyces sp. JV178]|uniref:Uncharacterized protein n=1 Tax=Streptomyces stelliscabiei TaxID=146820 RepID=A0A8I0TN42_9ACTN|nr:hypothetical protein IQ64_37485 [Streptomyces stelliscabiei]MBE1594109.1 hypothetical protein [Streptomyces stelliscabiei]PIM66650.1 hypothetical protein CTU88_41675 [Streptomyces sp. JV178]